MMMIKTSSDLIIRNLDTFPVRNTNVLDDLKACTFADHLDLSVCVSALPKLTDKCRSAGGM